MKKQSTSSGLATLSITGFICKILAVLYVPVQTAIVHDHGNSVISFGYRIYLFMYTLSTAGVPSLISKLVSEQNALGNYKNSKKIFKYASVFLSLTGFIFIIVLVSCARWITNSFEQQEAYLMLLTLSPAFIFTSINCSLRGYFQGNRYMIPTAISNVVEQFLNSVSTAILIFVFFKYTGSNISQKYSNAAAGSAIGTIIGAAGASAVLLTIYISTKKHTNKRLSTNNGPIFSNEYVIKQLFRYIIPALIGSVAISASDIIDAFYCVPRMIVGGLTRDQAYILNGQYSTVYQRTIGITTIVSASIMIALIPAISHAYSLNDRKALKNTINKSLKALYIFTIPCLFALTVFAKPIVALLFFNMNQSGSTLFTYWSWGYIFQAIIAIQTAILLGINKPILPPITLISGMVVKLILNYYLISIPQININGAAIGSTVGYLITMLLNAYFIKHILGIKIRYIKMAISPFVYSAIMCFSYFIFIMIRNGLGNISSSTLLINDISMITIIFVSIFIYTVLIVKSKTILECDIAALPMGDKLIKILKKVHLL